MTNQQRDSRKIVLLGEASVGKTSITARLIKDTFNEKNETTIGAAYHRMEIDGTGLALDFWDTAGQERCMALTPMYYRNAHVVLLVFDLSKFETMDRLVTYLNNFVRNDRVNFSCVVVGTKRDLVDDYQLKKKLDIITDKFEQFNNSLPTKIEYHFVSSKSGENIDELKNKIIELCNKNVKEENIFDEDIIALGNNKTDGYFSKCSC